MASFENLNMCNFDDKLSSTDELIPGLNFIVDTGLLPENQPRACLNSECPGLMVLRKCSRSSLKKAFFCSKCRKRITWSRGTIFDCSKLTVLMVLKLIFCWCQNKTITMTSNDLGISEKTVIIYFKYIRKVCIDIMRRSNEKIGGKGKIVEIDETMLFRRKYNRGRILSSEKEKVWVFGGIERESKLCFAEIVSHRDENTLTNVLKKYVEPGTTIYSDGWRAYQNLNNNGFVHGWVNHSENFLNPSNQDIHTQTIERKWRALKDKFPRTSNGPNRADHLIEFLYKSKFHSYNQPGLNFQVTLDHLKFENLVESDYEYE